MLNKNKNQNRIYCSPTLEIENFLADVIMNSNVEETPPAAAIETEIEWPTDWN